MKALIVEPGGPYRKILKHLFEKQGFSVEATGSGAMGLQRHLLNDFDLTCIAMDLDDMSGIQFCETLRKQSGARKHQPVIMLTSDEHDADTESRLQAGVTEVFRKSKLPELEAYLANFARHANEAGGIEGAILLVEDDEHLAKLFVVILKAQGFQVDQFVRAEDARQAFAEKEYDLVLTDILLAGQMTGLGMVRAVRGMQGRKARVPILVMSSMDDTARKIEVLREGASDFVPKPIIPEELIARSRNLVLSKRLLDTVDGQRERMQELAMTDQLTGLYNRHYMVDIAPKFLSNGLRHDFDVSLIVIDVDHFKAINDNYGHATGDLVLREVAKLLKSECRQGDFAGRFGGEEFVMLLHHCNADDALNWADQVREKLERLKPNDIPVTASFGIASSSQQRDASFDQLFSVADKAVYEAKSQGRNQVRLGQFP